MTIETLLYQPLRFTQCTSKRNMIEQKEAWEIRYVYILSLSLCALSRHNILVYHW